MLLVLIPQPLLLHCSEQWAQPGVLLLLSPGESSRLGGTEGISTAPTPGERSPWGIFPAPEDVGETSDQTSLNSEEE